MTPLETQLYEALQEALEWNWLDEDCPPPPPVVKQMNDAVAAWRDQQEREQNRVNY